MEESLSKKVLNEKNSFKVEEDQKDQRISLNQTEDNSSDHQSSYIEKRNKIVYALMHIIEKKDLLLQNIKNECNRDLDSKEIVENIKELIKNYEKEKEDNINKEKEIQKETLNLQVEEQKENKKEENTNQKVIEVNTGEEEKNKKLMNEFQKMKNDFDVLRKRLDMLNNDFIEQNMKKENKEKEGEIKENAEEKKKEEIDNQIQIKSENAYEPIQKEIIYQSPKKEEIAKEPEQKENNYSTPIKSKEEENKKEDNSNIPKEESANDNKKENDHMTEYLDNSYRSPQTGPYEKQNKNRYSNKGYHDSYRRRNSGGKRGKFIRIDKNVIHTRDGIEPFEVTVFKNEQDQNYKMKVVKLRNESSPYKNTFKGDMQKIAKKAFKDLQENGYNLKPTECNKNLPEFGDIEIVQVQEFKENIYDKTRKIIADQIKESMRESEEKESNKKEDWKPPYKTREWREDSNEKDKNKEEDKRKYTNYSQSKKRKRNKSYCPREENYFKENTEKKESTTNIHGIPKIPFNKEKEKNKEKTENKKEEESKEENKYENKNSDDIEYFEYNEESYYNNKKDYSQNKGGYDNQYYRGSYNRYSSIGNKNKRRKKKGNYY